MLRVAALLEAAGRLVRQQIEEIDSDDGKFPRGTDYLCRHT